MEQALKVVENVRKVQDNIAILIDTKGPEEKQCYDEPIRGPGETIYLTGDLGVEMKEIDTCIPTLFAEDIKVVKVLVDVG